MNPVSLEVFRALGLLQPYEVSVPKLAIGSKADGGYVIADLEGEPTVLSFGVEVNDDFELELASRGHLVHMFDHTVEGPPHTHENFRFNKIGICPSDEDTSELRSLRNIIDGIAELGTNAILKMDVEGAEWGVFSTVQPDVLQRFDRIVLEIHWLTRLAEPDFRTKFSEALRRLNEQFTLFHVHANNFCELHLIDGFTVADVLELSYVRTSLVKRSASRTVYPAPQNRANHPQFHDLPLLFYPFLPLSVETDHVDCTIRRIQQQYEERDAGAVPSQPRSGEGA